MNNQFVFNSTNNQSIICSSQLFKFDSMNFDKQQQQQQQQQQQSNEQYRTQFQRNQFKTTNLSFSQSNSNKLFLNWRNFKIENLKTDLDTYLKQIDEQKSHQNSLDNQFKCLQKNFSLETKNLDKDSFNLILETFSNQLTNLSDRLNLTENIIINLISFFSNVIDKNEDNFVSNSTKDANLNVKNKVNKNSLKKSSNINDQSKINYLIENNDLSFQEENKLFQVDSNNLLSNLNTSAYDLTNVKIPDEKTEEIARKIKEYMQISRISQRSFAESLLKMKQANFSFLLSHPQTWSELSKTYKDRYLIMYLWLNDPDRMEKLVPSKLKPQSIPLKQSKYSFSSTVLSTINREKKKRFKLANQNFKNSYQFKSSIKTSTSELDASQNKP